MKTKTIATALFATSLVISAQEKKEVSARTTAYQTSVSQEQLRGTTRRLKLEMIGLLDEFSQYQAATGELGKLKTALGELDEVTDQDMVAVVKILRDASRMEKDEETKAKLVEASSGQKEIQSLLRSIADRLTLQKEEAEIQQRLDQLALRQVANLRDTKAMAESGSTPEKMKPELRQTQQLNKAEQEALREEVKLAMDVLKKLAEKSETPAREAFEEAVKAGEENAIREQAEKSAELLATDLAEAAKSQEELLKNLQKMSQGLQSRKTTEEQSRELAKKMNQLSEKQEQLAKNLPAAWGREQKQAVRKEQEKISDQLELAGEALAKVNPEAAGKAAEAQRESVETAKRMEDAKAMEKIDDVGKAADSQKAIAEKLEEVSGMLQQQADALAGNESGGNAAESGAREAISNAVGQVMEAKSQMSMAKRQLQDGGDPQNAKERIDKAQSMFDQAAREVAEAGGAIPENVGKELQKGAENAGKAEEGVGVGSKEDQEKSRWNLDRAQENANRALAGLQHAANQLAAQQGQSGKEQAAKGSSQQPGQSGQSSKGEAQGGAGEMGADKNERSDISAVSKARGGQREALSLLQQEKAPTEYETMVQQYIRNLAEAAGEE